MVNIKDKDLIKHSKDVLIGYELHKYIYYIFNQRKYVLHLTILRMRIKTVLFEYIWLSGSGGLNGKMWL